MLTSIINIKDVKAYEYPDEYYYIEVTESNFGQITLLIPKNYVTAFSLKEDLQPINITSSNVTAYILDSETTVSFQPYQLGRYRYNSNYEYRDLNITKIVDTNIRFSNESDVLFNTYGDYFLYVSVIVIGGLVLLLWLKH